MVSVRQMTLSKGLLALAVLTALVLVLIPAQSYARSAWYSAYGVQSKEELYSPSAVPAMMEALNDRSANVRKAAVKTLARIGVDARSAIPLLLQKAVSEEHPRVRAEIIKTIGSIDLSPEAKALYVRLMSDDDANVRKMVVVALYRDNYRGSDFFAALQKMASSDPHRKVKALAAKYYEELSGGPIEAVAATPPPRTAPPRTAPAPAPQSTPVNYSSIPQKSDKNRYSVAVIIGNRNYANNHRDVPDVDYAHNDAQAMYDYVKNSLGYLEGNIIYLRDATQADLVSTFGSRGNHKGKMFDWVRANQSDIFVYYSGHGAPGLSDGKGYLLPVDANPMKVELNGYSLDTFYANLAKVPARSTTIILDACFSGVSANGAVVRNASSISLKMKQAKPVVLKETALLTAAGNAEVASWDNNSKHGLFTSMFLKGVNGAADSDVYGNGDGKITLGELKKYLKEEVSYTARRMYGRTQNPQITGDTKQVIQGH